MSKYCSRKINKIKSSEMWVLFCVYMVRTYNMRPTLLTNFWAYTTVLSTVGQCCVTDLWNFSSCLNDTLYPLNNTPYFPFPPAPGNQHSTFCFCEFNSFRNLRWVESCSIVLISFSKCPQVYPYCHILQDFLLFFFPKANIPLCMYRFSVSIY